MSHVSPDSFKPGHQTVLHVAYFGLRNAVTAFAHIWGCDMSISYQECLCAGVIEVLADALSDKNEKVRRRVMATLGELLFYVATQQQVQYGFVCRSKSF